MLNCTFPPSNSSAEVFFAPVVLSTSDLRGDSLEIKELSQPTKYRTADSRQKLASWQCQSKHCDLPLGSSELSMVRAAAGLGLLLGLSEHCTKVKAENYLRKSAVLFVDKLLRLEGLL